MVTCRDAPRHSLRRRGPFEFELELNADFAVGESHRATEREFEFELELELNAVGERHRATELGFRGGREPLRDGTRVENGTRFSLRLRVGFVRGRPRRRRLGVLRCAG